MSKGFTLMETLVAIAIVAILAGLAIHSYRSFALQGNRAEAIQTLLGMQLAEEKYRMNSANYGTLAQVWNGVTTSPSGNYTLSISNISATSYTLTATAAGNQAQDTADGVSCATMVLAYSNGITTRTPAACWMD